MDTPKLKKHKYWISDSATGSYKCDQCGHKVRRDVLHSYLSENELYYECLDRITRELFGVSCVEQPNGNVQDQGVERKGTENQQLTQ